LSISLLSFVIIIINIIIIAVQAKATEDGLVFISAFDDPWIVAGTGTMGLEILRNCTAQHLKRLHAIFVPVGGGGMLAGIASYVKAVNPGIKVYGVEPTGEIVGFLVSMCESACVSQHV
jgi:threonine dehydratase